MVDAATFQCRCGDTVNVMLPKCPRCDSPGRVASRWAFALALLLVTSCSSAPPQPKQVRVIEEVVSGPYIIGRVVEIDGRRYLLNTQGGIIELAATDKLKK